MKNINSLYPFFSLLFILLVDLSLLVSTHTSWDGAMKKFIPLQKEVMTLKSDLSEAHLWLEEAIGGDQYIDIEEDVMIPLSHKSFKNYYASAHTIFGDECTCLEGLDKLSKLLVKFEAIAQRRWSSNEEHKIGSGLDQEFDRKYQQIINIIDSITYEIDKIIEEEIEVRNTSFMLIIFFFLLMNGLAFVILLMSQNKEKLMHNLLEKKAHYDSLTDLPNRGLYLDRLNQAIYNAKRNKGKMAVVFLDIDKFKDINDIYGHDFGDEVLQEVGSRLFQCVREADTVSRFGGDEFTLLLDSIQNNADIENVMDKIMDAIRLPLLIEKKVFHMSISAGIAIYSHDGENDDELLKNADIAMYESKKLGRDRYTFYSSLADNEE